MLKKVDWGGESNGSTLQLCRLVKQASGDQTPAATRSAAI